MVQTIRKVNSPTEIQLINDYKFRPISFKFNYTSLPKTRQIKTDQIFGQHLEYVKCFLSIIITTRLLRKSPRFTIWEK